MPQYTVTFAEPHSLTDGDDETMQVTGYEDVGSMYILELLNGETRSVGKQLVDDITETDD
ncbi:hypothetical protein [Halorientalis regularis]|uniref:Uncharacterized protein n=1 Tax=Halorientalis regularis TaxID=660518 RepID=A0A1G7SZR9_9EURY|nr:hypothetical protein [Halorientalis regularis]SDG28557.1 hypothetical protein SAMN05216218_12139 [Halorientalis regularis]